MISFLKDKVMNLKSDLKRIHKSFVIWFNGLSAALITALPFAQDNFPQLQEYVSPAFYKHAMVAIIVGNIILRFKTNSSLRDK